MVTTTNKNKLKEFKRYLGDVESLLDYPNVPDTIEDQDTFEGNALKKAREGFQYFKKPVLADDSGIVVDVLTGRHIGEGIPLPGVYSARYASLVLNNNSLDHDAVANNDLLMLDLKNESNMTARYVTVLAYVDETGEYLFRGEQLGKITLRARGTNGFAYDELFVPFDNGHYIDKTYGELNNTERDAYSHRINAIKQFQAFIQNR